MTKLSIKPVLFLFGRHLKKYKGAVFFSFILSVFVQLLGLVVPFYYKDFFDFLSRHSGAANVDVTPLIATIAIILLIHFIWWVLKVTAQLVYVDFTAKIMTDLLETAFDSLIYHSHNFFTNNFTGSLVRKISRLPRSFEGVLDRFIYDVMPLFVTIGGVIIILLIKELLLGIVFTIWAVFVIGLQYFLTRWKYSLRLQVVAKDSETAGVLADSIGNSVTAKLFAQEKYEQTLVERVARELQLLRFKLWTINEWLNFLQGIVSISIEFILFFIAAHLWQKGIITVGDFALLQAYIIVSINRLWNVGSLMRQLYDLFADAHEAVEIIDLPHEIVDMPNAATLKVTDGKINFNDVTFGFEKSGSVLQNFNLKIAGGEKIALVGSSGAGKSTIVRLLFRFHDISGGVISIDGQNIKEMTQESLRKNISLVPQEPILFHRTLMDNIRYGKQEASDEEVIEAAKKAHCHEFISKLNDGYGALVGERGIKLSGGERQRVAIARAILKNAPILVLDEATSSLDSESEKFIQEGLRVLMEGKTVLVVAHRLSTIMSMDRIIVIENGVVTDTGTHRELIEKTGLYNKLWAIQAGGFISDSELKNA